MDTFIFKCKYITLQHIYNSLISENDICRREAQSSPFTRLNCSVHNRSTSHFQHTRGGLWEAPVAAQKRESSLYFVFTELKQDEFSHFTSNTNSKVIIPTRIGRFWFLLSNFPLQCIETPNSSPRSSPSVSVQRQRLPSYSLSELNTTKYKLGIWGRGF